MREGAVEEAANGTRTTTANRKTATKEDVGQDTEAADKKAILTLVLSLSVGLFI